MDEQASALDSTNATWNDPELHHDGVHTKSTKSMFFFYFLEGA
jgi:hypothetical protein